MPRKAVTPDDTAFLAILRQEVQRRGDATSEEFSQLENYLDVAERGYAGKDFLDRLEEILADLDRNGNPLAAEALAQVEVERASRAS